MRAEIYQKLNSKLIALRAEIKLRIYLILLIFRDVRLRRTCIAIKLGFLLALIAINCHEIISNHFGLPCFQMVYHYANVSLF